ncbi:unnamed protein product [Prunus armeniaca]|uniref:Uncharacterized protein n=1 Tax=Prunus armeniaca TaxID=36596 RepID=A0A6J5WIZ3_PRUAR|nr:unnamed protein product [Prunus armeniaca]
MAESVACFVIEKLVSLLISTEAKLSRDVRKEVGCIRDELESIQSFLKDADAKAAVEGEMDDSIKTWVRQVREAASLRSVKSKKGKTLEEVGEEYLTELIHRSLVQVSRVYTDGKARSCRVHDLLREILLRKGMESSFCHMLSEHESNFTSVTPRLSIDSSPSDALRSIEQLLIRSVLTYNQEEWHNSNG